MLIKDHRIDIALFLIIFLTIINYVRIYLFHDVVWDDNCWLQAAYSSTNLKDFLNTGFYELRRVPFGIFEYYFFGLHKFTDNVYFIWQSMNLSVQVLTPIFLYMFLKKLFTKNSVLPFFAAVSLVVFPLDHSLLYQTVIAYRIATLLTVISFYLTAKAVENSFRWSWFIFSLALSVVSYYIFLETSLLFELARLFIIGWILYDKNPTHKILVRKTFLLWFPFVLLAIPLIIYKLSFKPYGIYEMTYRLDSFFLLNFEEHSKMLKILLQQQWKILFAYIRDASLWSVLMSALGGITGFLMLKKILFCTEKQIDDNDSLFCSSNKIFNLNVQTVYISIILGLILMLPQIFILEFANREISSGMNSSHFNQVQIGYAIVLGSMIYLFYSKLLRSNKKILFGFIFILVLGTGTFFNNLNIDLYFKGWEKQKQFWQEFTNRFPSLPENAVFMMDVRDWYYHDNTDLDNTYDLEPTLNILYNDTTDPKHFRKYKVFAMEEFRPSMIEGYNCSKLSSGKIERTTHFGKEFLDPCKFIVVYYHEGKLLVNKEIIEKYPDIIYGNWANKDFPILPLHVEYPLRYKLEGFSKK